MNFWHQLTTVMGPRRGKPRPLKDADRDQIQQLLRRNREVEAIKVYRAATNASLQAAVRDVRQLKQQPA